MRPLLPKAWQATRDNAGCLSTGLLIVATYLAFHVPLLQPKDDETRIWLGIFLILCLLALLASYLQQRGSNAQAKKAAEDNDRHTELLNQIAAAVGVTQAEAAESAADTKRQVLELQVRISDEAKPVIIIRLSVDGDKHPDALPTVENIGKTAATNIRIEDIVVNGAAGPGSFEQIDALAPGERRQVDFDAPDQGMAFRRDFIRYLQNDLEHRPPIRWEKEPPERIFTPLKMPLYVTYTDPITGKRYRAEHELEFTFFKHATVIFKTQSELA